MESAQPLSVLVSYSHRDEDRRQELITMLAPLVREGLISIWSDHKIVAGVNLDAEIQIQLKKADIVLLMVSPDFLASDYCYTIEMSGAIERHENGRASVVPIVLRPCDWTRSPFARLKTLPTDAKPVSTWLSGDEAWLVVSKELRKVIELEVERRSQRIAISPVQHRKPLREALRSNFEEMQQRYEVQGEAQDCIFGLESLNEITNGIQKGELFVAAAQPQSGLLELSLEAAISTSLKFKKSVLFASPRISAERLSQRLITLVGRIDSGSMQRGLLADEDWSRVNMAIKLIAGASITFYDAPDFKLSDLERFLSDEAVGNFDLVVVDGLEYMTTGAESDEVVASRRLRSLARKYRAAVLANLTIGPVANGFNGPAISDLKNWHPVHHEADGIILLRLISYVRSNENFGEADLNVVKNPRGPAERIKARYWEEYGCFGEFE